MPTTLFHTQSDTSVVIGRIANNGPDTPQVLMSHFLRTSEDKRIAQLIVQLGARIIDLRFEFVDPLLPEMSVLGKPLYSDVQRF